MTNFRGSESRWFRATCLGDDGSFVSVERPRDVRCCSATIPVRDRARSSSKDVPRLHESLPAPLAHVMALVMPSVGSTLRFGSAPLVVCCWPSKGAWTEFSHRPAGGGFPGSHRPENTVSGVALAYRRM